MQAEPADQLRLLDLAAIDTRIAQLNHRRTSLPEHAEIKELAGQRSLLTEEIVAAEARLSDVEVEQERLESDLGPARERLERNKQRIDSGAINDPKALKGVLEENSHLEGRIAKLEDDELEVMQAIEDIRAERDAVVTRRNEVDTAGRAIVAKRDAALGKIEQELVQARAEREAQVKVIPAALVDAYDKLTQRLGSGAAELINGRCDGCRLEANLADLRKYKQAAPNQVVHCEECGRILVRAQKSGL